MQAHTYIRTVGRRKKEMQSLAYWHPEMMDHYNDIRATLQPLDERLLEDGHTMCFSSLYPNA